MSAEPRRENVAALIDASLQTLDNEARAVFMAFGSFFAPQLTAELLTIYFESDGDSRGDPTGRPPLNQTLMRLHDNGLAEYFLATDTTASYFRIHDLSYAYAVAQANSDNRYRAIIACLTYAEQYEKPGWDSFHPLLPVLDALLGAAEWALNGKHWEQGKRFFYNIEEGSQILTLLGYYGQKIRLLEHYARAALQRNDQGEQGKALGNLGTAYQSLGDYPRAIQYHEQALAIARQIGDKRGEGNRLGNLGNTYRKLGDYPRAIQYYEQVLKIAQEMGDKYSEGNALGSLGTAYQSLGDYPRAIQYYEQALAIARQIGDKRGEGNRLGNLGNAYGSLGDYTRAIQYYEQALAISRQIGDKRGEGNHLGNLGNTYYNLGDYPRTIQYCEQALVIRRQIGDRNGEASNLNNLGAVYEALADYPRALNYFTQARALDASMGLTHMVELVDRNIAIVQAKMAGGDQS